MSDQPKADSRRATDWYARIRAKEQEAAEKASKEWRASDATEVPSLEFETPKCPICCTYTVYDEGLTCEVCDIWWPDGGYGDEAQCTWCGNSPPCQCPAEQPLTDQETP